MTEQQCLLNGNKFCKQCVMPPHDIVASLFHYPEIFHPIFTGEPGAIGQYWRTNMDLYDDLGVPDLDPRLCNKLEFFFGS